MPAHPSCLPCRHALHQRVGRDILRDDGADGDEGVFPNGDPADNGGVGADGGTFFDYGCLVLVFPRDGGPRVVDIGKDAGPAEKDIILDNNSGVEGDVVLELDAVTGLDPWG